MSTIPSAPRLVRGLGPLMATAVVVGTVIGSGVFKKPAEVADHVPYFGLAALAWILVGLLVLCGALAFAEVATLFPRAGGNFVFLREAYGRPFGFLFGWVEFWIIRAASLAALATIFTESLHNVLTNAAFHQVLGLGPDAGHLGFWEQRALTVAVIFGLAVVNLLGVRWGGGLQLLITTIKVLSLLAILALPFLAHRLLGPETPRPEPANLRPAWPETAGLGLVSQFGVAMVGVLWAYHGWMNIAPVAEEVRRPQRNIALALLTGVGIIIFLYLGANLAYALLIPQEEMRTLKDTPVVTVFSLRLLGPIGAAAASAAVMCSVFGALNGNLLVGPRLLYAMGEDDMAPRALAAVHPRFRTPVWAIVVLAAWSALLVVGGAAIVHGRDKALFDFLTDFAIFGSVTFETLGVATIFVFRRRFPHFRRTYRCPGYPVVPALYVLVMALVLVNMFLKQTTEAGLGAAFIASGAVAYFLFVPRRSPPPLRPGVPEAEVGAEALASASR